MVDLLIPIGTASSWYNNELRFCLRSIEAFATGYNRIFLVGEVPDFIQESSRLRCFQIGEDKYINREARIALKVLWTFKNTDISRRAVFWNDDFILTRYTDVSKIASYQRGDLLEAVAKNNSEYNFSLIATHEQLRRANKPGWHYDIHAPIIFDAEHFIALEDWWQRSARLSYGFVVKSVYCNNVLASVGPTMPDCKLKAFSRKKMVEVIQDRWIFSYGDIALRTGLKNWLREHYPNTSKFERYPMPFELAAPEYPVEGNGCLSLASSR